MPADPQAADAAAEAPAADAGEDFSGAAVGTPVASPKKRKRGTPTGDTVLVTGASGFIGSHLIKALVDAGRPARALVRSQEAAERVRQAAGETVEIAMGDVTDASTLVAAATGCGLVYHLAGAYRGSDAEISTVHLAGTAKLLRAVAPEARVVYVSSTSVYGWDQDWPAAHDTRVHPTSAYGRAKLSAEHLVLARNTGSAPGSGVVARTTIVYGIGDERGMMARAVKLLSQGRRRWPGTGDNRIHLIHVDDLVAGLMALAGQGDGVFLFAGPETAPTKRIFGLLAEGAGLDPPTFGLSAAALRPLARALDTAWTRAGRQGESPLSRHSLDVLTRDRSYSASRAVDELGWEPQVGLDAALPPVGAWLAERAPMAASGRSGAASRASGNSAESESELGFDWRGYFSDPDEGLGTVYERFALHDVLLKAIEQTGATSVLHAPLFGMMGIPGIDAVFLAQQGMRVGLVDFVPERMDAVVGIWKELGLDPETHLVPSADPATWPEQLQASYDLVFSFAALWWFADPWAALEAQARWAAKGVLVCVPNLNVFMRARGLMWQKGLFDRINADALDRRSLLAAGEGLGLRPVDTGLFDIPPFPDTCVPLAKVIRAAMGKKADRAATGSKTGDAMGQGTGDLIADGNGGPANGTAEGTSDPAWAEKAWVWSILPFLRGEQPDLEARVRRLDVLERKMPAAVQPAWAHHRYTLFLPPATKP